MNNSHRQKAEGGEHSVHIFNRDETGLVCLATQPERIHCNFTGDGKCNEGGGRAPPPSPALANFTLMIECTPESSRCLPVYRTLWGRRWGRGKQREREKGEEKGGGQI